MIASVTQRWRAGRASYRPAGEPIRTGDYDVALLERHAEARSFVEEEVSPRDLKSEALKLVDEITEVLGDGGREAARAKDLRNCNGCEFCLDQEEHVEAVHRLALTCPVHGRP